MIKITKEQVEEILRRMDLNGASFIDVDVRLHTNCFDETWIDRISIDEHDSKGRYIDTILQFDLE